MQHLLQILVDHRATTGNDALTTILHAWILAVLRFDRLSKSSLLGMLRCMTLRSWSTAAVLGLLAAHLCILLHRQRLLTECWLLAHDLSVVLWLWKPAFHLAQVLGKDDGLEQFAVSLTLRLEVEDGLLEVLLLLGLDVDDV